MPLVELLEDRLAPASIITVTTLGDGIGSFSGGGGVYQATTLRGLLGEIHRQRAGISLPDNDVDDLAGI